MRCLKKNKQSMYYATYTSSSNVVTGETIVVNGETIPVEIGSTTQTYSEPVAFEGNISFTGGEVYETEYGIDLSNYSAVLVVNKDSLPLDEHSIIWYESPTSDEADYKVVKVVPSLNVDKYLLQRIEK